ncbi:MAG: hypothetical protein LAQ69_08090 [Acidobacteriia bacterium]|nr:hypothetical protein [Terriglobia bacterium]
MKLPALSIAMVLLAGPVVARADKLEDAFQLLKTAVESKDAAQVKKQVLEIYPLTCEVTMSAAPKDEEEKAAWTSRVAYAKDVELYAEYALYATAIQSPAATTVDLISTLEEQNPKSKYLNDAYGPYFVALNRTGAAAKVPAIAEKALANFPENEDLLLVLADAAMSRKQSDRALTYANRLTAVLSKHPKPEAVAAADWERKRSASLGHGYWIAGMIYGERNQYAATDKNLRAALPFIKSNDAMSAPAYFYLGMANYQLGLMTLNKALVLEGARFSDQSAAIASAYTEQARHNALVMKAEAAKMR